MKVEVHTDDFKLLALAEQDTDAPGTFVWWRVLDPYRQSGPIDPHRGYATIEDATTAMIRAVTS